MLIAGVFAATMTGVLLSPPDAVHGLNHDYHAIRQQRSSAQQSITFKDVFAYYAGVVQGVAFGGCIRQKLGSSRFPDSRFPLLTIIRTWRLRL